MTTDNATDVGAAPQPPAWALPGAQPSWDSLAADGATIASWTRDFGDVWIAADDRIANGRVLRSKPAIHYSEEPGSGEGIDPAGARRLAAELLNAADLLDHPDAGVVKSHPAP